MKYTAKLLRKEVVAEATAAFHFEKPKGFEYMAGQTIDLTLLNPAETDKDGNTRPYTIASAPHEDDLIIATRMRDSSFKRTLRDAGEGLLIEMEGPFGSFTLHENIRRPAIILVGGIGITPFRSMIMDALHRNLPHQIYLFYSNRTPQGAPFLAEFEALSKKSKQFVLVSTMTDKNIGPEWKGEKGYITLQMIQKYVPQRENALYYTAGPQEMVKAMRVLLHDAGVSGDDIKTEEFSGY